MTHRYEMVCTFLAVLELIRLKQLRARQSGVFGEIEHPGRGGLRAEERVMSEVDVLPELKQIIGAMLFANKGSLTVGEIRRCLEQVAEIAGRRGARLRRRVGGRHPAGGRGAAAGSWRSRSSVSGSWKWPMAFRLENDVGCGPWLRQMLQKGRANRLSRPSLETLAIIAYRQPVTRGEIEAVRGVAVDQIIRNLMDLQLIKITGRSELPGPTLAVRHHPEVPGVFRTEERARPAGRGGTAPDGRGAGTAAGRSSGGRTRGGRGSGSRRRARPGAGSSEQRGGTHGTRRHRSRL
jgi:chromosome segregation and condensation protein ScpB